MGYEFKDVKELFDTFYIENYNGKYMAARRSDKMKYDDEQLLNRVKFSHTWYYASKYGHSQTGPSTGKTEITEEDYTRAFSDSLEKTYESIMHNTLISLEQTGQIPDKENLKQIIKAEVIYAHCGDVVEGLYSTKGGLESFVRWATNAADLEETNEHFINM